MSTAKTVPKKMGAPWDQQQNDKIWRLREAGHSYKQIAEQMGRSEMSIKQRLTLLREIHRHRNPRPRPNATAASPRTGRWDEEEDARLRSLKSAGKLSNQEIADVLRRNCSSVKNRWTLLRQKSQQTTDNSVDSDSSLEDSDDDMNDGECYDDSTTDNRQKNQRCAYLCFLMSYSDVTIFNFDVQFIQKLLLID